MRIENERDTSNGQARPRRTVTLIVLVLGLLVGFALAALALVRVVDQSVRPAVEMSGQLGTQVSQWLNPTPTILPDPVTVVREVRALARLETIQYTVEKVIRAETGQGPFAFLVGDKLLFVAHGVVIAGVDLSRLGPEDLWLDERGRVYLRLPESEVFIATLDNEKSYVYDRETGLLTGGDVNLEAEARKAAEREIREAALEDGILEQARVNAENYLFRFLRSLGFPDVIYVDHDATPGPTVESLSTPSTPTP